MKGCDNVNTGLPLLYEVGAEVKVTLDCEAHTVSFIAPSRDKYDVEGFPPDAIGRSSTLSGGSFWQAGSPQ